MRVAGKIWIAIPSFAKRVRTRSRQHPTEEGSKEKARITAGLGSNDPTWTRQRDALTSMSRRTKASGGSPNLRLGIKTYLTVTITEVVPLLPAGSNASAVIVREVPDWSAVLSFLDFDPVEVAVVTVQV